MRAKPKRSTWDVQLVIVGLYRVTDATVLGGVRTRYRDGSGVTVRLRVGV